MLRCSRGARLELHHDPAGTEPVEGFVGGDGAGHGLLLGKNLRRIERSARHESHELGDVLAVVAVATLDRDVSLLQSPLQGRSSLEVGRLLLSR
jgi:hypothetical protein